MYTMSGPALNIPTGREIRQNNREQRRNITTRAGRKATSYF